MIRYSSNGGRPLPKERQLNTGFYSPLTQKYYDSREAQEHYEREEKMRRAVPTEEELAFEALPAEEVRKLVNHGEMLKKEQADREANFFNGRVFCKRHPEFVPCPENANKMVACIQQMGIKGRVSDADIDRAYDLLRAEGSVQLDPVQLRLQEEQRIEQRAREITNRRIESEDELYALDMQTLRMKANGVL